MGWDCKFRKWVLEELLQWRMSTSVHFTCTRFIISKYKFCFVWNYFTAAPHLQKRHWTAGVQRFRALLGLCHMMLVVLSVRVAGSMPSNCAQWRTWWNCRLNSIGLTADQLVKTMVDLPALETNHITSSRISLACICLWMTGSMVVTKYRLRHTRIIGLCRTPHLAIG